MAASFLSVLLSGSTLLSAVRGQDFTGGGGRDEDAFSYVQPLDTVILTEYGSSPPVYPSRMSSYSVINTKLTIRSEYNRRRRMGRCSWRGQSLCSSTHHRRKSRHGYRPSRTLCRQYRIYTSSWLFWPVSSRWTSCYPCCRLRKCILRRCLR